MAVIIHVFIICQWCSNHNQTGVLLHPPVQVQTRGGQVPAWERGSSSVYSPSLHLRHPQHWEWDFSVRVERELLQYIQPAEGQVLEEAVSDKGLHWVFPTLTVRCFFCLSAHRNHNLKTLLSVREGTDLSQSVSSMLWTTSSDDHGWSGHCLMLLLF